jgi:glutamate-1-semialdehyde aminotransferase
MQVFEEIFYSGTHGGETLALAAARVVLDRIAQTPVLAEIEARGQVMLDGVGELVARHGLAGRVTVGGEPQRTVVGFTGDDHLIVKSWVQQTLAQHGVLFNGGMFICARHTDADVTRALEAFDAAFAPIAAEADLLGLLEGPPVQAVFRTP